MNMLNSISENLFPKINFLAGSERKFADFISELGKEKIALLSHVDSDGVISARIANEVIQADYLMFLDYNELNGKIAIELKKKKVKYIIMTDLGIDDEYFLQSLEGFAKVLIIDHHPFKKDWNSSKTVFLNAKGFCGAFLCYYLFSKINDIKKFDWLVACACVADWEYFNNKDWMGFIYKKYGDEFVGDVEGIKVGKFWDLQYKISLAIIYFHDNLKKIYDSFGESFGEIGDLGKYADEVQEEIVESVKNFDREKQTFKEGWFWEFNSKFSIKSILINIISSREFDKTFIFIKKEGDLYHISARRQDRKVDMGEFLKKLIDGFENSNAGGHVAAAGGYFPVKYLKEFKKRIGL